MAKLKELRKELNDIKLKGMNDGLTFHDYLKVKKISNRIDSLLCAYNQEWCDFYEEVNHLLSIIVSSDIFHTFTVSNIEYIKKHAPLLPLVLANNKGQTIDISGTNYYFPCQFHLESTPSLRIVHVSNYGFCFGCGEKLNPITYLQEYENLKFPKALQLLAQIYLFDVKKENTKLNALTLKYQQSLLSEEYFFLLNEGLERYKKLNHSEEEMSIVNNVYEESFRTIERIRNHEVDPNFIYEQPKRVLYLKK